MIRGVIIRWGAAGVCAAIQSGRAAAGTGRSGERWLLRVPDGGWACGAISIHHEDGPS